MIRSIAIVTTGTLASRLSGFVRDAMIAALLGAGAVADAFVLAFQLITLIRRLLTEGALNAAFVPAWLRIRRERGASEAAAFTGRAVGSIGLGIALLALVLGWAAPVAIEWLAPGFAAQTRDAAVTNARWMLPYLAFAGPVAVLIALANAQRRVALSSAAPVLFNLVLIATMAMLLSSAAAPDRAAWIVAAAVGAAGLLQITLLAGTGRAASPLRVLPDAETRTLFARALPGMIASAGPQLLIVGGAILASRMPSAVSWLYFASRLIDLPLGIVSTISGAVLVTEAAHAAHNCDAARRAQADAISAALALALPAAIGLFMLAAPIVHLVFARGAFTNDDAENTARALQMLAFGLPAQALFKALSPAFYAKGDTLTPMLATLAGLAAALAMAWRASDIGEIAAAIALGSTVGALVLLLRARLSAPIDRRLVRIVLATCAMAAALIAARHTFDDTSPAILALLIVSAFAIYAAALLAFGAVSWRELRAAWDGRGGLRGGKPHGTGSPIQRQDQSK